MQDISLEKLSLIGYDKINQSGEKEKTVHFFLDDYRFESIYKNPDDKIERLKNSMPLCRLTLACLPDMFCLTKRAAVQQAESEQATRSRLLTRTEICRNFRDTKTNPPERVLNGGAARLRKIIKVIGIIQKLKKVTIGI